MPIAVLNFFGTYSLNLNNSTVSSHKRKFSVLKLKIIKYKKKSSPEIDKEKLVFQVWQTKMDFSMTRLLIKKKRSERFKKT